ncbi:MAG: heavy metal sensor histidine kinase [Phycisphaerales bacterium]|nr:heavy metal sensor histidine kinase [Phycisphaerales bacterium]
MSFDPPNRSGRRVPIGWTLTLWGTAVTLAISLLLCGALYVGVSISLRDQVDAFLVGEVYEFLGATHHHTGSEVQLEGDIRQELGSRLRNDLGFRILDLHGKLIITSDANDMVAAHWRPPRHDPQPGSRPFFETIVPPDGTVAYRLCTLRERLPDGRDCFAQASYSLEWTAASLGEFRRICAVVLALAVLLALAAGRFLAWRSLVPLRQLAATAQGIGAAKLNQRMPVAGVGDEFDRLAVTLNEMLAKIERYVRQLKQFTADASHELRTPLSALRGAAEVALSRPRSSDELRQVLEEQLSHYERLQRIAEDLLLLARLDAGENVLIRERVDLNQAVSDVVDLFRPLAEDRRLQLEFDPVAPVTIEGDNGRIKQLLSNLVDNAVKFTPGPGRVVVGLIRHDGVAEMTIADTGIGINGDHLPRVFDRFYRVDDSRSSKDRGAGLGLSICRSIAEAHGGRIAIESRPLHGTTVRVTLPVRLAPG